MEQILTDEQMQFMQIPGDTCVYFLCNVCNQQKKRNMYHSSKIVISVTRYLQRRQLAFASAHSWFAGFGNFGQEVFRSVKSRLGVQFLEDAGPIGVRQTDAQKDRLVTGRLQTGNGQVARRQRTTTFNL